MLQRDKKNHSSSRYLCPKHWSILVYPYILSWHDEVTRISKQGSCALWIPTPFSFLKFSTLLLASLPWSITLDSSSLVHQPLDFSCLSFSAFLLIFNTIRLQLLLVFCPKINIPTCWLCHLSLLVSGWDCQWSNLRPRIYWVNTVSLNCIPILHLEFFISQISLQWL